MGTIDANGVFIYDNTDHVVPLASFMNLGQQSVSEALAEMRADLTPIDTGWIDIPLASGRTSPSGYTAQYRKIGPVVHLQGRVNKGSSGTVQLSNALPYRPEYLFGDLGMMPTGATTFARLYINSSGELFSGADSASSTTAFLGSSFVAL